MFKISDLLQHDNLVIQCHNNPDADAIASGFAVYEYCRKHNKNCKLIYSGKAEITKANLLAMLELLSIPLEFVPTPEPCDTLVLVDAQYGERNVDRINAKNVFVIDHHMEVISDYNGIINSNLGSCSTLVWSLLKDEGFDFKQYPNVQTALYYGLFTDTSRFEEISHPLDKDMRDNLKFNNAIIKILRNNNLILSELEIIGNAFKNNFIDNDLKFAIFKSEPCDPNILGIIGDYALEVEKIDVCVVYNYNEATNGYKLSVRSCSREVMANDFAAFITKNIGGGGGHAGKAGGQISKDKFEAISQNCTDIQEYLIQKSRLYFDSYDVVYSENHALSTQIMDIYQKLKTPVHYAKTLDIFPENTPVLIRTLEGDVEIEANAEIYLMIGIEGEVYPIKSYVWATKYVSVDDTQSGSYDFEYSPTVINKLTSKSVKIIDFANTCIPTAEHKVYAMQLKRLTKVFTLWKDDGYYLGEAGDYIAVSGDNNSDVYVVRKGIFEQTYKLV